MARRRIGQEQVAIMGSQRRGDTSLDEISQLVNWSEIGRLLTGVSAAAKGELGWSLLALFRALLLATWHDFSDVLLAEALDDQTSFCRFCGLAAHQPTPDRTAFVHFRRVQVGLDLDRMLFGTVTHQLYARGVVVRCGSLVDATLLSSASIQHDVGAKWVGHRRRKPVHGYKTHVATDQKAVLIRRVEITTANVHDAGCLEAVLPPKPGEVYGDSAFASAKSDRLILARDDTPLTLQTGFWGGVADALARLKTHNVVVRKVRCRIEKVFGTCKRSYGLRRMRWLGLAKAGLQARATTIAYNLRRSWRLLAPACA